MLRNFLKVSIRNLVRNKTYSVINILGLSIGMACSILIFLFIFDELSYDKFNDNAKQIYRIGIDAKLQGTEMKAPVTGAPVGPTFVNEIPEVLGCARVIAGQIDRASGLVTYGDKKFEEQGLFYVDSTFFDLFSVNFIKRLTDELLTTPYTVVITESIAKKYFSEEEPLGKSLNIRGSEYIIQAVIQDSPSNTHLHYTILASFVSTPAANLESWIGEDYTFSYLLLDEDADINMVMDKMKDVARVYIEPDLMAMFGIEIEDFENAGNRFSYTLMPLTDIHLRSHTDFEIEANSNIQYVYIFSIIAVFILIIAIINFMNLTTARSATRAKEVGIRKVIGAKRKSLFLQFLFESIIMSIISLIIGMVIIETVLPIFNDFTLKQLSIGYGSNFYVIPVLLVLAICVGLISGVYSASYLSSSKILNVIKGKLLSNKSQSWFRSALVVFQFSISITLFISTILIYNQLQLIRSKDIGFDKKNIVTVQINGELRKSFDSFKQELEANPLISVVTASSTLPARAFGGMPVGLEGDTENKTFAPISISVDSDFLKAYDLKLKEGRFFSEDFKTDTFAILINESAVTEFGFGNEVLGKRLVTNFDGQIYYWKIIGVVKNFNYRSLHQDVGSLLIMSPFISRKQYASIKLKAEINETTIDYIRQVWNKFNSQNPFEYQVLEDDFNNLHKEEFRTGDIFLVFSILAILIACLGLFGLASFITEHKTKEIGIRKSMGASIMQIISLLLAQFTKWVAIANLIAWPVAYYFMKNWLQSFAYQVGIKWWIFILSAFLGLLIAVFTVSSQAIKAARANPVDSLRYE